MQDARARTVFGGLKKKKKKRISLKWDVEEGLFLCLNSIQGIEISAVKQYSLFSLLL